VTADLENSATCPVCDRPIAEVDGGADWLHLEVTRGDSPGDFEYIDADFCTQAHAAEWLSEPLPTPSPSELVPVGRRERWLGILLAFCALWAVGLMLLGAYALVRLLGGWN
jgi:hypothetical protein